MIIKSKGALIGAVLTVAFIGQAQVALTRQDRNAKKRDDHQRQGYFFWLALRRNQRHY